MDTRSQYTYRPPSQLPPVTQHAQHARIPHSPTLDMDQLWHIPLTYAVVATVATAQLYSMSGAAIQTTHMRTRHVAGAQAELLHCTPPAYTALVSQASHPLSTSRVGACTPVSHGTQSTCTQCATTAHTHTQHAHTPGTYGYCGSMRSAGVPPYYHDDGLTSGITDRDTVAARRA